MDEILIESEMDLDSIICVDFDIDGGEHFIWEQSEILKNLRPPVLSLECRMWYNLGKEDYKLDKGIINLLGGIKVAKELGYVPVMCISENVIYISEEYVNTVESSGVKILPINQMFDINTTAYMAFKRLRKQLNVIGSLK